MLQKRQFDLQLTFMSSSPLSKNIQNQTRAIQHSALQFRLQISLLAWAERMIEHHDLSTLLMHLLLNLRQLSTSHKSASMRHVSGAHYESYRITARRQDKLLKLARIFTLRVAAKLQVHEHSPLPGIGTIKKQYYLVKSE
jgi:hypothetical protein